MEKLCTKCGRTLPVKCFNKSKGHLYGVSSQCKDCWKVYTKRYYASGKARVVFRKRRVAHPHWVWSTQTVTSHRKYGLEVLIDPRELEKRAREARFCAICGGELDWTPLRGKTHNDTPSLDRIDNTSTLTLENTQIVCHLCNRTKNNRTMKESIKYCERVIEYRSK